MLLTFNKLKALTSDVAQVAAALHGSQLLQVIYRLFSFPIDVSYRHHQHAY